MEPNGNNMQAEKPSFLYKYAIFCWNYPFLIKIHFGNEFEWTLGDSEEQESLVDFSPWGHRVGHDWETEQLVHLKYYVSLKKKSSSEIFLVILFQ